MSVEMNGIVWKKFVEFFRNEKGYSDWTEDEIEFSRNDDDTTEFMEWLVKELASKDVLMGLTITQVAGWCVGNLSIETPEDVPLMFSGAKQQQLCDEVFNLLEK